MDLKQRFRFFGRYLHILTLIIENLQISIKKIINFHTLSDIFEKILKSAILIVLINKG